MGVCEAGAACQTGVIYFDLINRVLTRLSAQVTQKTRLLSEEPDQMLLARLRILEKKMGLVLTLVRRLVVDFVTYYSQECIFFSSKLLCGVLSMNSQQQSLHMATTRVRTI